MSLSRYFQPKHRSSNNDGLSCVHPELDLKEETGTCTTTNNKSDSVHLVELVDLTDGVGTSPTTIDNDISGERKEQIKDSTNSSHNIKLNRFAQFAYQKSPQRPIIQQHSVKHTIPNINDTNYTLFGKKRQRSNDNNNNVVEIVNENQAKKIPKSCKKDSFIPMKDLPEQEQQSEIEKWHTIITYFNPFHNTVGSSSNDNNTHDDYNDIYTIEDRRYHMVLATILHTRCQETNVRVAIQKLANNWYTQHHQPITIETMTNHSNTTTIHDIILSNIQNLQYYNTKVKYIIGTSLYIRDHFKGIVPTTEKELLQLPGIGPLFADLLCYVNTTILHEKQINKRENMGASFK